MSGETFELFKIAVFSEAIDRSTEAIRDWERLGVIPRPLFSPQGEHCKRWYSVAQVINCHRIMRYRYGGRKYFQNHDLWEQFINDIKKVWFARNIIVGVDGKIMGVDG